MDYGNLKNYYFYLDVAFILMKAHGMALIFLQLKVLDT